MSNWWRASGPEEDDGIRRHEAVAMWVGASAPFLYFAWNFVARSEVFDILWMVPLVFAGVIAIGYALRLTIHATYALFVVPQIVLLIVNTPTRVQRHIEHASQRKSMAGGPPRTLADALGQPIPTDFEIWIQILGQSLFGILTIIVIIVFFGEIARYAVNAVVGFINLRNGRYSVP